MILLPRAVRVYFATQPMNLRKSYDGLSNEVRSILREDPLSGHVFVFLNRRKNQVKLLLWTRGGLTIVQKRLERGTFTFPQRVRSGALDAHFFQIEQALQRRPAVEGTAETVEHAPEK